METSLNNGMCRCCASEGTFKNFSNTYHWMGQEEVYADMLKECFDISLTTSEPGEEGGICEVCITQLRNAANFKKQVQHTEEQFKRRLENKLFKSDVVKIEAAPLDEVNNSDNDNNLSDNFSELEFELPIKKETEEPKPKKRAAKPTTSRAKKPKLDDGEPSTKRQTPSTKESTVENMKLTLDKRVNFSTFITIKPSIQASKRAATMGRLTELDLHFDNIKTILRCSNATPVRCKVGDRYACGYCLAQFNKPNELKSHTLLMHTEDQPEVLKNRSLWKHIVYLDITSLFCKNCDDNLDNLKELMEHLKTKHDEVMHLHIKNQVVPCKFDGDDMKCGNCLMAFNTFDDLEDHMDEKHYRNYVCDFCDKGYTIRNKLLMHKKSTHRV